ncbi:hypothetical protein C2S52_018188 [Perilla frutescens var. hirtella]|nr:hypothetical protein C2S52_018188 [Perilla frutescens var. hirtella]
MGKGGWFSSVKKALSLHKIKEAKRANKSKKILFGKERPSASDSPNPEPFEVSNPHPLAQLEDRKLTELENEHTNHTYPIAAAETELEIAATDAASDVVQVTAVAQFAGEPQAEVAAIKIQTAFRGYMARRALRALRGLVRLKSLVDGPTAERQTTNTLKCMQTLSRLQAQIQSRRIRMLDENRALQRQLLQKRAKELENLRMSEEWDDRVQSKEEVEATLLHKFEAAMRRERALAYSYTHQQTWKKSAKLSNLLFMDPTNPQWGWSWLDRLMAANPLETKNTAEKDLNNAAGEITKSYARHQLNSDNPSPPAGQKLSYSQQAPVIPSPKAASSLAARKLKHASPKVSIMSQDDDSRSVFSVQSDRNMRRHSIAGSSVRDNESLDSSPSIPSYMTPTRSTKAKLKLQSPSGMENGGIPDKESAGFAKKRLSFPPSPGRVRRHSGPPKVEMSSMVDSNVSGVSVN